MFLLKMTLSFKNKMPPLTSGSIPIRFDSFVISRCIFYPNVLQSKPQNIPDYPWQNSTSLTFLTLYGLIIKNGLVSTP